jgi:hypothetical protein
MPNAPRTLLWRSLPVSVLAAILFHGAPASAQFAVPPPGHPEPIEVGTPGLSPRAPEMVLRVPRSQWRPTFEIDVTGQGAGERPLAVFQIGLGAIRNDQLLLDFRLGGLFDTRDKSKPSPYVSYAENRVQIGLETGYRFQLAPRLYFVPLMGLYGTADLTHGKRGLRGPENSILFKEERSTRWSLLPSFGAGLNLGALELAYRYQIDTHDTRLSTHGVSLGVRF